VNTIMKTKYTYELKCPCCDRLTMIETTSRAPLPVICCSACDKDIFIELDIIRVHVNGVEVTGQDTVQLFHHLNNRRSNP
jgi:hypothetical protein